MNPAKMDRYCASINVKLNAVTAGQSLTLLIMDVGTVLFIRSQTSASVSPDSNDCIPKKYVLNMGVKQSWFTVTFVAAKVSLKHN